LEIPFRDGESRDDESHDDANPSPSSLWVQPEAMAMALSGELFDEPLTISDSARADALACLGTWDYDTLALQEASGGHALLLVGEALFEWHQLHEPCHVDRKVLHHFLRALEACYGNHEYHNSMHGADVALGVHHFIVNFGLTARLTKLELLAALVGALVHDFNHPGTNNGHEVRARTERARTHTSTSSLRVRSPPSLSCTLGSWLTSSRQESEAAPRGQLNKKSPDMGSSARLVRGCVSQRGKGLTLVGKVVQQQSAQGGRNDKRRHLRRHRTFLRHT
jgi:hypothetical protein